MYATLAKSERDALRALATIVEPVRGYGLAFADNFKHTFVATVYSLISVSPMLMMVVGILTLVRAAAFSNSTYATPITRYFLALSARIRGISIRHAFAHNPGVECRCRLDSRSADRCW
jgi:hypothetical protein